MTHQLPEKLKTVCVLTSNPQKSEDFAQVGFPIENFPYDIPEILSDDVEKVALHKAFETPMNNIIVEDTSLYVEGAPFYGTEIKHIYEAIQNDESYHDKNSCWKVSLCLKTDTHFFISTGTLDGKLKYPALDYGYHFNRIFSISNPQSENNERSHFAELSDSEKQKFGPRFQAINQLINAFQTNDFSKIKVISKENVKKWDGLYQNSSKTLKKPQIK